MPVLEPVADVVVSADVLARLGRLEAKFNTMMGIIDENLSRISEYGAVDPGLAQLVFTCCVPSPTGPRASLFDLMKCLVFLSTLENWEELHSSMLGNSMKGKAAKEIHGGTKLEYVVNPADPRSIDAAKLPGMVRETFADLLVRFKDEQGFIDEIVEARKYTEDKRKSIAKQAVVDMVYARTGKLNPTLTDMRQAFTHLVKLNTVVASADDFPFDQRKLEHALGFNRAERMERALERMNTQEEKDAARVIIAQLSMEVGKNVTEKISLKTKKKAKKPSRRA
jgi:hypothetical protein